MFCRACGAEITANDKFCPKCGTPAQNTQANPAVSTENGTFAAAGKSQNGPAGKKSTKKKSAKGFLAVGIILAVAVLLYFVIVPKAKNFYYGKIASPKKLLVYSLEKSVDESASSIASIYRKFFNVFNPVKMGGDLSADIEIGKDGEALFDLLSLYLDMDLSKIKKAGITISFDSNKNKIEAEIETTLNKDGILSADLIVDNAKGDVYLKIPELSSDYLGFEVPADALKGLGISGISTFFVTGDGLGGGFDGESYELISEILDAIPKDSEIRNLVKRYGYMLAEGIGEVSKEKGVSIEVGEVSQSCILLEATIDADTLEKIEEKMLDTAEDDKDIRKIAERIVKVEDLEKNGLDEDSVIQAIQNLISGIMRRLRAAAEKTENQELVFKFYVDDKSSIVGLETEFVSEHTDFWSGQTTVVAVPVVLKKAQSESNVGYYFSFGEAFEISGTGKKTKDKVTGEFIIKKGENEYLTVSARDFNVEKLKNGEVIGEFTVAPGKAFLNGVLPGNLGIKNVKLQMSLDLDIAKYSCKAALLYKDDEYITANISVKLGSASDIKIPKKAVMIEEMEDLEKWAGTVKWDKVLKKLEKTALPEEVTDYLDELFDSIEDGDFDRINIPF